MCPPPPPPKKMLKMLVRLMQNRLIFSNICREYSHEIRHILLIVSQRRLSRKIPWNQSICPRICPWKFLEMWLFCPWPIRSPGLLPLCQHDNLLAFLYSCYFCQSPPPAPLGGAMLIVTGYGCLTVTLFWSLSQVSPELCEVLQFTYL